MNSRLGAHATLNDLDGDPPANRLLLLGSVEEGAALLERQFERLEGELDRCRSRRILGHPSWSRLLFAADVVALATCTIACCGRHRQVPSGRDRSQSEARSRPGRRPAGFDQGLPLLNLKELQTPGGVIWPQESVTRVRKRRRIRAQRRPDDADSLTMDAVQPYLGVGRNGLVALLRRGVVSPNQLSEFRPWRVSRAQLDSEPLQSLVRVLKQTGRLPRGGSPKNQLTYFDDEP